MHRKSALELRDLFAKGEVSATEIAKHFLGRIDRYNGSYGAFLKVLDERTLERAKQLDEKRSKGEPIGKLAGVPVALKDNIHLAGELTTCASKFLTNFRAPFSATVTQLMEAEGAIIIGKTNLDEFAMGSSTEHSALMETSNPWNPKLSPGGSSGGSAVAVTARLAPIGFGSDTGGSIRQPASFCGIFGFKPTYGRVSRYGLVAFASSLDQIGPFTAYPEDIALTMEVIGRHCPRDSTSLPDEAQDYLSNFGAGDLTGKTIGVPWAFLEEGLHPEVKENFEKSIAQLEALGATIREVTLDTLKYSIAIYYILATAEASTNLARFDGVRYGVRAPGAETLDQVYDLSKAAGFGAEVKRRIMLGTYVLSSGYKDAFYRKAQKVRSVMINEFKQAYDDVDLIAMPVSAAPAFERHSIRDPLTEYLADLYTISCNLTGQPAISVPSGFTQDGRPMSLQLIGPQRADREVVSAANLFAKKNGAYLQIPTSVEA
jgi:aspartyl-tRNA(Asn)/glutamyl-tRNA(Gln) amidotransferase subunit A